MKKIQFVDATLMGISHSSGLLLKPRDKFVIARQLKNLGLDIIIAGRPFLSKEDFETVSLIASGIQDCSIAAECGAIQEEIEVVIKTLAKAEHPVIYISMSITGGSREKSGNLWDTNYKVMASAVMRSREFTDDVILEFHNATKIDYNFLEGMVHAAFESGASVVNISDSAGVAMPWVFSELLKKLSKSMKESGSVMSRLGVNCGNGLGLAVANTLEGIRGGADQAVISLFGVGEGAGGAALEETAAALNSGRNKNEYSTRIKLNEIAPACSIFSNITGIMPHTTNFSAGKEGG
jgi:2-isopropylmalate synthase